MAKLCGVCGDPVGYHRSKYCAGCAEKMHNGNIGTGTQQEEREFVGAWFEADDLKKKNLELAKYGRRICRTHQGAALPLTEEYFYKRTNGKLETECKECARKRGSKNHAHRYATDPVFAARKRATCHRHFAAERERRREYARQYKAQKRQERINAIYAALREAKKAS